MSLRLSSRQPTAPSLRFRQERTPTTRRTARIVQRRPRPQGPMYACELARTFVPNLFQT